MSEQHRTPHHEPGRDAPDATIVIPTRNRWPLLSTAALPGALAQEDVSFEVVVVDDGSSDDTPARLAERAERDPRLRVVRHERSRGVAQARNAGIDAAAGRWVAFLDDDDLWSPRKLRAQIDAGVAGDAGFVYGTAAWVDESRAFLYCPRPPEPEGLAKQLLRWNVVWAGCSNVIARTDLVRDLGGFDEELFQLADWDLWIRLALAAPAALARDVLVGYVMQPQSMLLTDRRDVFLEFDYLVAKHARASRAHAVPFDRARFARWVALGHLRAGRRPHAARTYLRAARHGDLVSLGRALGALVGPAAIPAGRALLGRLRGDRGEDTIAVEPPAWLDRYGASTSTAAE
jgi:glycosyltransferase involved in cell wall biosynthesis